ncbi:MAG TPA: DUF1761 domain-containing protein, partial [Gemmatimonadales bacterium]
AFPINVVALLVAVVVKVAIGWLWYSPALFFRRWRTLAGLEQLSMEQMQQGMGKGIAITLAADAVMAYVLVHATHYAGAQGPLQGAAVGFFTWLGFVFTTMMVSANPEKRPYGLVFINSGYQLLGLTVMGSILATWT